MEGDHPTLIVAVALVVGVIAQGLARHLRVPGILLLLVAGVGMGPDGLGWVHTDALGPGLFHLIGFAVAVILFEGGLNLEIRRLRREQTSIRRLVTWGALVTAMGAALAVRWQLDWPWVPSILFGTLVIVTGPTVIGPLLRDLRLAPRAATVLEAEGVLIDPIGALVAVLAVQVALAPEPAAFTTGAAGLAARLAFGLATGALFGLALAALLRTRRVVPEGMANVFTLAWVVFAFELSDRFLSESGILTVTIMGVVVGNLRSEVDRDLREFKDQLTVMLIGLLFVLLAADVRLADLRALGWGGLATVGLLVVVVRPLNVWISMPGSDLSWREKLFLSAIAPRGIVAAAVATLTATAMDAAGVAGGSELRALVFLTIAATVTLAGLGARPLAALLRVRAAPRDAVAIMGSEGLGLALAARLREEQIPVILLDSNPHHVRAAEEAGFTAVFGNALDERTLARARLDRVRAAIGLTSNEGVNSLFAAFAREEFGVPETYVALVSSRGGVTERHLERQTSRVLLDGPHDVERWNVRFRHGQATVQEAEYRGVEADAAAAGSQSESYLLLALHRGDDLLIFCPDRVPEPGDVATVALYESEREQARAELARLGWELVG